MLDFRAERQMMLALHDRPSEADPWRYFLALELGKLPHELDAMPVTDLVHFKAYFTAKRAKEEASNGHAR